MIVFLIQTNQASVYVCESKRLSWYHQDTRSPTEVLGVLAEAA